MKSTIGEEEEYLDILQNIEGTIYKIFNQYKNITDRQVDTALTYIMEMGKAQLDLPSKFLTEIPSNVQTIIDAVNDILEARTEFTGQEEGLMTRLKCVYRVLDSVKTHYSSRDDCSYLNFIGQFM